MDIGTKAQAILATMSNEELLNQNVVYRKLAGAGHVREAVGILNLNEPDYFLFLHDVVGEYHATN